MTTRFLHKLFRERFASTADPVFRENFAKSVRKAPNVRFTQPSTLFRVDPPGIFCGRDPNHPLRGTCRFGVTPADIVINTAWISAGHREILRKQHFTRFEHRPDARWIASWKDEITGDNRYVMTKTNGDLVRTKFEHARALAKNLKKMKTKHESLRVILFLLEHLCIRIGNEKDTNTQGDTVGICTLRAHVHVRCVGPRKVHFRFPGKDSVLYDKTIQVPEKIMPLFRSLLKKRKGELLFDVKPDAVNRWLQRCVPGCTARTFRTMRASKEFEKVLHRTLDPTEANKAVANLLNHKRNNDMLNLETSRKNYIDPRIYFAFCKRTELVPKWFLEHRDWAENVSQEFCF
jgi:hypothetical protein